MINVQKLTHDQSYDLVSFEDNAEVLLCHLTKVLKIC